MRGKYYDSEEEPDCYPLSDGEENILKTLSPNARKRVDVLKELQRQHDQLKAKLLEEKTTPGAALEAKDEKLFEPFYTKRYEIVNGVVEVEGVYLDPEDQGDIKGTGSEKGVPGFWLNALKSHEWFQEEISERDEEALKFLKDIKWCRINDPKGFKFEFFFDTNPFFKNSVLTKTYHMTNNEKEAENAIGTDIEWYPGKCLRKKIIYPPGHINNPRGRGRFEIPEWKPVKVLKIDESTFRTMDCPSFFDFFKTPEVPEDDSDSDSDPVRRFQHCVEQDYELGSELRDKIIPQAVLWFTGEADEYDFVDMKDDTEEYEDDEYDYECGFKYGKNYYCYDSEEDYEDHKYEKKTSGPTASNLASLPSGSSVVPPARSTLNASAPPFIPSFAYGVKREFNATTYDSAPSFMPNLGYGVEKKFNVGTFDSFSDEYDSNDEEEYLEIMKKKVCQELNLDSSVSTNSMRTSNSGKGFAFGREKFTP